LPENEIIENKKEIFSFAESLNENQDTKEAKKLVHIIDIGIF